MGCAANKFRYPRKGYRMLCYYMPAGNVVKQPVFERGIVCTDCEGVPCSKLYIGLCGRFTNLPNSSSHFVLIPLMYFVASFIIKVINVD